MSQALPICLWIMLLAPLASFAVLSLGGRWFSRIPLADALRVDTPSADDDLRANQNTSVGWIATAAIAVSLLMAVIVLAIWVAGGDPARTGASLTLDSGAEWLTVGSIGVPLSLRLDSLAVAMCLMITLAAACIHLFSIAYMSGAEHYRRFFAFLSLFCFAMLALVLCENLLLLFVCWELVGLCSYVLIGFWFEKREAASAAFKAFVVNRVGDCGLLIAIGLCAGMLGTLSLETACSRSAGLVQSGPSWLGVGAATWLGVCLVVGAIGKSAQFPLHVWLPDAMAGPTPVSALIHAATMVAAGVYLLARVQPMLTPAALALVALVGGITLLLGAIMALVQTDLKRVLAYSTMSQLGYMLLGIGVGAWSAAVLHLLLHGFFKALLFLAAGQAMLAAGHEGDMRRLGGLSRKLPLTFATFAVAAAALAGVGIPFTPLGVGAFFSKEAILGASIARAPDSILHMLLAITAVLGVLLTAIYIGRAIMLTFIRPASNTSLEPTRESAQLGMPLIVLAAATLLAGWLPLDALVQSAAPTTSAVTPSAHTLAALVGFLAWVAGFAAAYWLHRRPQRAAALASAPVLRQIRNAALARFGIDATYQRLVVTPICALAEFCRAFDEKVVSAFTDALAGVVLRLGRLCGVFVDARGVDGAIGGVGATFWSLGGAFASAQSGRVRQYVLMASAGVASLLIFLAGGWDWALLFLAATVPALLVPWREVGHWLIGGKTA